jgi:hypothetical protein
VTCSDTVRHTYRWRPATWRRCRRCRPTAARPENRAPPRCVALTSYPAVDSASSARVGRVGGRWVVDELEKHVAVSPHALLFPTSSGGYLVGNKWNSTFRRAADAIGLLQCGRTSCATPATPSRPTSSCETSAQRSSAISRAPRRR